MQNRIHRRIVAIAATVIALPVAPAVAAAEPAPDYSGAYLEVRGGYDRFTSDFDSDDGQPVYGIGAGYDVRLDNVDNVIVGVGAGIDFSDNDHVEVKDFEGSHHYEFEVRAQRDIEVTARIGIKLWHTLVYARAGYSNARFTLDHPESTAPFTGSRNFDGLRVGGGLEWQVSGRLHAKAEYRFTNYEFNLQRHQVIGALGYRF